MLEFLYFLKNFITFCLQQINCLENCYSETLPEIHHAINSYSENQRNRLKTAIKLSNLNAAI